MNKGGVPEFKEQASSLLELALLLPFAKEIVGQKWRKGIRFVFFRFFIIESYTCQSEPVLTPLSGLRLVFWKKLDDEKKPAGWNKWRGIPIGRTNAIAWVHENFIQDWTANARRLTVTLEKKQIRARKVSLKEFGKAYHASGYLDPMLRYGFLRVVKDHLRTHEKDVSILHFSNTRGILLGGTVFVDYPDIDQSHYLISFLTLEGRKESTGYAFIHWWYKDMIRKGIHWADFGIVWQPGDPASWKGYSQFKKRFHPQLFTRATYWKRA